MDNLDWTYGTKAKFGLYNTDFSDPYLPRRPKLSAKVYSQIIRQNGLLNNITTLTEPKQVVGSTENDPYRQLPYEDEMYFGTFPKGFAWSSATAAYQVEGAWDEDGKRIKFFDI
jgi:lactase-phlorizin hydrolase